MLQDIYKNHYKYSLVGDLKLKYTIASETRPGHKSINEERVTHKKMKKAGGKIANAIRESLRYRGVFSLAPAISSPRLYPLPSLLAVNAAGILR